MSRFGPVLANVDVPFWPCGCPVLAILAILEGMRQPENDTREVAEKIINAMQQHFELGQHQVRVTTSIGLAIHQGEETDLNELLRRADDAMYRAKQRGKNCWCH